MHVYTTMYWICTLFMQAAYIHNLLYRVPWRSKISPCLLGCDFNKEIPWTHSYIYSMTLLWYIIITRVVGNSLSWSYFTLKHNKTINPESNYCYVDTVQEFVSGDLEDKKMTCRHTWCNGYITMEIWTYHSFLWPERGLPHGIPSPRRCQYVPSYHTSQTPIIIKLTWQCNIEICCIIKKNYIGHL